MTTLDVAMAQPAQPSPEARRTTRVRPWVAALASILWPGAGHFVAGRFGLGLLYAAVTFDLLLPTAFLTVRGPLHGMLMYLPATLFVAFYVWVAADAWRKAVTPPTSSWLRRWGAAVALCIVVGNLEGPLGNLFHNHLAHSNFFSGVSMSPTILPGESVFFVPTNPTELRRGDLVEWRAAQGHQFVFRVVGLPGDLLEMRDGALVRNGHTVSEPFARHHAAYDRKRIDTSWLHGNAMLAPPGDTMPTYGNWGPVRVPARSLFFLGDDRDHSSDSRFQGFARFEQVTGRAVRVYFSSEAAGVRWGRIGHALDGARRMKGDA